MFSKQNGRRMAGLAMEALEQRCMLAGDIAFSEPVEYRAGVAPNDFTIGDWNGDSVLDLAVKNFGWATPIDDVSVFMGIGDGKFAKQVTYDVKEKALDIDNADVNNDGHPDLVFANGASHDFSILINQGDGTFVRENDYPAKAFRAGTVDMADMNGDGHLDIVGGVQLRRGFDAPGEVVVLSGNGDGTFESPETVITTRSSTGIVRIVDDLDGDGDIDIVLNEFQFGDTVHVYLMAPDGTYGDPIALTGVREASGISASDLNNDGNKDLAVADSRGRAVAVFLANGDGTFAEPTLFPAGSRPSMVIAGDMDLDGDVDLVVANPQARRFNVLINDGTGRFENRIETRHTSLSTIAVEDFNGDKLPDVVLSVPGENPIGRIAVFLNETEVETASLLGDSNRDGVFDQLDIVRVLQAAKYLTGEPARFEEGDWNEDGVFDQLDIVSALAAGTYLSDTSAAKKEKPGDGRGGGSTATVHGCITLRDAPGDGIRADASVSDDKYCDSVDASIGLNDFFKFHVELEKDGTGPRLILDFAGMNNLDPGDLPSPEEFWTFANSNSVDDWRGQKLNEPVERRMRLRFGDDPQDVRFVFYGGYGSSDPATVTRISSDHGPDGLLGTEDDVDQNEDLWMIEGDTAALARQLKGKANFEVLAEGSMPFQFTYDARS